ncbi:MAG: hypothetical protein HS115_14870 [Spirochaetales bacterium]|nr:hypothetical protein [Spirochaetales bacterium]
MKLKMRIFLMTLALTRCLEVAIPATGESKEEFDRTTHTLLLGVEGLKRQKDNDVAAVYGSLFELRGAWNSYTGNGTTQDTVVRYPSGLDETVHTDSSAFGGYASCEVLKYFNNAGLLITQNPENYGACFSGDTNKGKYNKSVYFRDGGRVWICSVAFGKATFEDALNSADNANRSSPGTAGCGSSAWSRIEKR